MADAFQIRPIVVPRNWVNGRLQFAIVFAFEFEPNDSDDRQFRSNSILQKWPDTVRSLHWVQTGVDDSLLSPEAAAGGSWPYLEVALDGAVEVQRWPVARSALHRGYWNYCRARTKF